MSYEEWQRMTQTMLDFYGLSPCGQQAIMLMVDGLRFRALSGTDSTK